MTNPRHSLGLAAEDAVAVWLSACGWRLVARRHRSTDGGEVDLVALDPTRVLVAIEVRARRTMRNGAAAASVDQRRIGRLGRSLASIAASCGEAHEGLRIDLVTAEPAADQPGRWRLRRIPGIG
ncbi:MAG: YraN family protein [Chloroflexi bacterium]|nr:YraN family protein [Chloroflexota bacterium]MBA3739523.1 YraN family protein [Chloroflexota bacterium]